ncbi:Panacea domain-containing protein [Mycobacterium sp. smrl_JER01]|uniref:Panacea domain-containing protein n=1 Tax=Mycobacterium sp. smrl_JER01 TaxID=3402633 RepID=UPI003AC1E7F0
MYRSYKDFGKNPIDPDVALGEDFDWDDFAEVSDFVVDVWDRYGSLAAWALRERTHREAPWRDAFGGDASQIRISEEALLSYFKPRPL